ncbi:MAG: MGMT family protein [Paenibacillus macerans]|uniref:DNA methyltransferase n=2 Tax=Paenibacillus TaxID=44249 RepID=A0A090ZGD9_PAEMA|nr:MULTISPECIES: MGMT family protein [Paenibacillus]KFN10389.1 6-O-methylguanine DNA methyltransferase, DNA binding domain protein [Paenibacillus macerans]MBS5912687.1 MGMT family protein [Paenibacillus macerans]MCY7558856.1 MGMT family protein [Paenibacillus macerans]MDU5947721.1 MGMT family protein [Paenibacillus macerans]MDU7476705.1 MGMT family protein [Paenibacillus macerans]
MQPFTAKVIEVIAAIPPGKVMTYGQIAACAGSPRAARQVVRILHSMSRKHGLPWHRVVNGQGQIALQDEESFQEQVWNLEAEDVEILPHGRIDLTRYQYHPDQAAI